MNNVFALENNYYSFFFLFFNRMKMSSVLSGEQSKFGVVIGITSNYLKVIQSDLCRNLWVRKGLLI